MNKYLQMLKAGNGVPSDGSKGPQAPSEPFEPARDVRKAPLPATRAYVDTDRTNRTDKSQVRKCSLGSKGSKAPSEPFEPERGERAAEIMPVAAVPIQAALSPPWEPRLASDDLGCMHGELVRMIEMLADLEGWDLGRLDDTLTRATRAPLSALSPDIAHFSERLLVARAEAEARATLDRRTWHGKGFTDRRGDA